VGAAVQVLIRVIVDEVLVVLGIVVDVTQLVGSVIPTTQGAAGQSVVIS